MILTFYVSSNGGDLTFCVILPYQTTTSHTHTFDEVKICYQIIKKKNKWEKGWVS